MRSTQLGTIFLAFLFAVGGCSPKGVEIVSFYPVSPTVFADETDELRYGVAVKDYGNSASSAMALWADADFNDTDGDSCSTGPDKGWFEIRCLEPDETWSSYGPELSSLTQIPVHCTCKRGTCSGSVTFWLFTGRHSESVVPSDASEVTMSFDQYGNVTGYSVISH